MAGNERLQQRYTSQLSSDLWAKIFTILGSEGEFCDGVIDRRLTSQAYFFGLRLVCKKFNDVFEANSRFFSSLVVSSTFPPQACPGLLTWLSKHRTKIQNVATTCGSPCLEIVLSGLLLVAAPTLTTISLLHCTHSALHLMSGLRTLHTRELHSVDQLDLTPFAEIAFLQCLILDDCTCTTSQLPVHLTKLDLSEGSDLAADPACSCLTSLQTLVLWDSHLSGLHPNSLSSCTALQELDCFRCSVGATNVNERLQLSCEGSFWIPSGFSALTGLARLNLEFACNNREPHIVDMSCLYSLTTLQRLVFQSGSLDVTMSAGLTNLDVYLRIEVGEYDSADEIPQPLHLNLQVDWQGMKALQQVIIISDRSVCDASILGVSKIASPQHVDFGTSTPDGASSSKAFAALLYCLALHRPDLDLTMHGESIRELSKQ